MNALMTTLVVREAQASARLDGETQYEGKPAQFTLVHPPVWRSEAHSHVIGGDDKPLCHSDLMDWRDWEREQTDALPRHNLCGNCLRCLGGQYMAVYPGETVQGEQAAKLPPR